MTAPLDPKDILDQADDLLDDINQANLKFVNQTNQTIKSVNQSFKKIDKYVKVYGENNYNVFIGYK